VWLASSEMLGTNLPKAVHMLWKLRAPKVKHQKKNRWGLHASGLCAE
jgi:hypothetical protein